MSNFVLAIAIAALILLSSDRENFVEQFGFSGYSKPINIRKDSAAFDYTGYTEDVAQLTSDEMNEIIKVTQAGIKTCSYPLETNSIKKYTNAENGSVVYKCAFTFMAVRGFPFGFGVNSDVTLKPSPQLLGIRTQPISNRGTEAVIPYQEDVASDFVDFEMIAKSNIPTLEQLRAGENAL